METPFAPERWYHVGPHGFYDLVRFARRGRTTLVRIAYVLAVFGALALVHQQEMNELTIRDMVRSRVPTHEFYRQEWNNANARIAERFSIAILIAQNLAVLILMPVYMCASMNEEREKQTLQVLFTTHLTAREFVLGKWVSCVVLVGSILLGGLPLMALAQLWGGIDMPVIAANFCNTGLWLISVSSFSALIASKTPGAMRAIFKTALYMLAVFGCGMCCCSYIGNASALFLLRPFGGVDGYLYMGFALAALACVHLLFARTNLRLAILNVERQRGAEPIPLEADAVGTATRRNRFWRYPPISDEPVAWKELYLDSWPAIEIMFPLMLSIFVVPLALNHHSVWRAWKGREDASFLQHCIIMEAFMILSAATYLVLVAARMSGTIVRERERQTLDSLLTIPIASTDILAHKLVGNLLRYLNWIGPFGLAWLTLMCFGPPFTAVGFFFPIVVGVHVFFFAMLGLALSVYCKSSLSAHVSLAIIMLVLALGTYVLAPVGMVLSQNKFLLAANPLYCWITMVHGIWHTGEAEKILDIAASTLIYFAAGNVLWFWARRRFARLSA